MLYLTHRVECPKLGRQDSEAQNSFVEKHLDEVVDIEEAIIEEKVFEMQIEVTEAIPTSTTLLPKIGFL